MIIYKTVQKAISQDSQQKMQFLAYKTTLMEYSAVYMGFVLILLTNFAPHPVDTFSLVTCYNIVISLVYCITTLLVTKYIKV